MNVDAANSLSVDFREPRAGSCLTKEMLAELATLIYVKAPETTDGAGACTSKDPNNLASLDGEGCVLVPAAEMHQESQSWIVSSGDEVEFDVPSGFDATQCFVSFWAIYASNETGTSVDAGAAHIWPKPYMVSLTAAKVTLNIKNATQDATLWLQLLKVPTPPDQA